MAVGGTVTLLSYGYWMREEGWRRQPPGGQQGTAYRGWAAYLTLAAISALFFGRPVRLVFYYTVVGSWFFPFVITTLLWLNNSKFVQRDARNGLAANVVLGRRAGVVRVARSRRVCRLAGETGRLRSLRMPVNSCCFATVR